MRAALLALLAACLAPLAAAQGGLRVSPIGLEMAGEARTTFFRVENDSARARAFELHVMRWKQDDGADVLTPSGDLIVSPSVFELPAGRAQIVRAALRADVAPGETELAYRFLLRELTLEDAPAASGLRLQLELSLPLFVRGRGGAEALTAQRAGGDVVIANAGAAHVRLAEVRVGGEAIAAPRYLLAGSWFRRPAPRAGPIEAQIARGGGLTRLTLADAADRPGAR